MSATEIRICGLISLAFKDLANAAGEGEKIDDLVMSNIIREARKFLNQLETKP